MAYQDVLESLSLFLNDEKSEETVEKLERFKEDGELFEKLEASIGKKELPQYKLKEFTGVISILDNIVLQEYPVDNPVKYSSLYIAAVESNRHVTYGKVLAHLRNISGIEKELAVLGIQENEDKGKRERDMTTDKRPYATVEGSYLFFLRNSIIRENENHRDNMIDLDGRLANFEEHYRDLKEKGIDLAKLFSAGYTRVIEQMDAANSKKANNFKELAEKVAGLLVKLDEKGFDIYNKRPTALELIKDSIIEGELDLLSSSVDYISKEALMYMTNIHLKKESTGKKSKGKGKSEKTE